MLPLIGILIVVAGFALRLNALLVVTVAGMATGVASGQSLPQVVAAFGRAFVENRYVALVWLVVPVIGLVERGGLRARARALIRQVPAATPGRVLLAYLALRQVTSALGLVSLGGHAQMVRPVVAPMAEGAAERMAERAGGTVTTGLRHRLRALAASADNVGFFFGEDVFVAIGAILLIRGFLEQNGILVEPLQLARWAIPTALVALAVHGTRLLWLDRAVARDVAAADAGGATPAPVEAP
jgi:uncharacterized membrane protein